MRGLGRLSRSLADWKRAPIGVVARRRDGHNLNARPRVLRVPRGYTFGGTTLVTFFAFSAALASLAQRTSACARVGVRLPRAPAQPLGPALRAYSPGGSAGKRAPACALRAAAAAARAHRGPQLPWRSVEELANGAAQAGGQGAALALCRGWRQPPTVGARRHARLRDAWRLRRPRFRLPRPPTGRLHGGRAAPGAPGARAAGCGASGGSTRVGAAACHHHERLHVQRQSARVWLSWGRRGSAWGFLPGRVRCSVAQPAFVSRVLVELENRALTGATLGTASCRRRHCKRRLLRSERSHWVHPEHRHEHSCAEFGRPNQQQQ